MGDVLPFGEHVKPPTSARGFISLRSVLGYFGRTSGWERVRGGSFRFGFMERFRTIFAVVFSDAVVGELCIHTVVGAV